MVSRLLNIQKELGKSSTAFLFGARGVGKTRLCEEYLGRLIADGHEVMKYDLLHNEIYQQFLKRPHLFRLEVAARAKNGKPCK
jgi:hypothetical protein